MSWLFAFTAFVAGLAAARSRDVPKCGRTLDRRMGREAAKRLIDEAREERRQRGYCDGKNECTGVLTNTYSHGTYCRDCGRPRWS